MQFDRDKLEEEVLEKVKEVNEESGYRPYFELPEYVNIVASIMEEKFKVEYDDLVNQIHLLSKELDKEQLKVEPLKEELGELQQIIKDTLRALPVGSISRHTPESIPERVQDWVKEAAEECRLREQWEACADMLFEYAHEFVQNLSAWGKGYDRYDKDIKQAEDAIEEYNRLKNEI